MNLQPALAQTRCLHRQGAGIYFFVNLTAYSGVGDCRKARLRWLAAAQALQLAARRALVAPLFLDEPLQAELLDPVADLP
jgi:hypothetical protein